MKTFDNLDAFHRIVKMLKKNREKKPVSKMIILGNTSKYSVIPFFICSTISILNLF